MQIDLPLMGSVTRPKHQHSPAEMRCCTSKAMACRLALMHAGMAQDVAAERLCVTPGYMSMLLSGKRHWSDALQRRLMTITGSLAPLQWDALQEGVELYADPVRVREAQLMAELAELRRAA